MFLHLRDFGLALIGGCATPKGATAEEKRAYVLNMRDNALARLYREKPGLEHRVRQAPGYGVFSNISTAVLFVGSAHGYGVVVDNQTGKETYMKMLSVGVGLGVSLQDMRAIFVFNDRATLRKFVTEGWEFGVGGAAALKSGDTGAAAAGTASFNPIDIYELTEAGIALRATLDGTKYSIDKKLN